jgi:glyoxylase-like metal-dependent hydrolase (beta-lactamase superfamily II)
MTESDLKDLGIHRIPVPVPFPQAGGPVNVYAIEEAGGGLLLFDSGLGTDVAREALAAGFRAIGRRYDEVTRIVVSHGHVDHYGGARAVQEGHGGELPVYAHPDDAPKISEQGWRWRDQAPRYGAYLARLGVPGEVLLAISKEGERGFGMARRLAEVRPIGEGDVIRTKHLVLEVLHMPGHTPGLLCAYDRATRLFLSDDHLLEHVSPNPLIELGPGGEEGWFRPLLAYLENVGRMHRLDIDLVLPGHGAPFTGHRRVIDSLVQFYGKRQAKIRETLAGGPLTGWDVTRALFPWAKPRDAFLTVSETVANLEVLEARGEVLREDDGGSLRFALAG